MSQPIQTIRQRLAVLYRCVAWHHLELAAYHKTLDEKHEPDAHRRAIRKLSAELIELEAKDDKDVEVDFDLLQVSNRR
jgi:hypothetical protein